MRDESAFCSGSDGSVDKSPWPTVQQIAIGIFVVLATRQIYSKLVPVAFGGEATTLRADDYWAFSSGFFRRGLLGEILYLGSELTGINWSHIVALLFVAVYFAVLRRILQIVIAPDRRGTLLLLFASPLLLCYPIDREILLLIPALLLSSVIGHKTVLRYVALSAIPILGLIHEFSLLFYVPLLVAVHLKSGQLLRSSPEAAAVYACVVIGFSILIVNPEPTLRLEREFWPRFGLSGLEHSYLYSFATMNIRDTLGLHLSFFGNERGWTGALLAILMIWYLLKAMSGIRALQIALLTTVLPFLVLTVDYGRYAYFLFAFFVLAREWYVNIPSLSNGKPVIAWTGQCMTPFLAALAVVPTAFYVALPPFPSMIREIRLVVNLVARILGLDQL